MTPEEVVKQAAEKLSRRFFWATVTIIGAGWLLGVAAVALASLQLAGIAGLLLIPALACALAGIAFQSPTMHREQAERIKQKLKS